MTDAHRTKDRRFRAPGLLHRYGCPYPVGGPCMCETLHEAFMEGQKMAAEVFKDFAKKLRAQRDKR